ncbi:porin family protein [Sphingobacterium sp. T2]|uniref:porin family protein n=1 Tax=Sphingobacterium sp. T2 TaxID=1590596 RepID=UPI00057B8814|nr:porin family protein [Sphingobacterium sp. T2]
MKNTILTLFVAIFSSLSLQAQEFKLGLKAGMNFSKIKFDKDVLESSNNAGYLAGVWLRLGGNSFHIQPEAYFTTKNASVQAPKESAPTELIKGDMKFSNIDVPILLGTKFPVGPLKLKLQAGPLFSFVIDQEASFKDNIVSTYDDALKSYKDKFAAVVAGTGLDFGNFAVDLRYEYGLGNISKTETAGKQKLNLWSISLGYSLF